MRRQRNMAQMKEQNKTPEKELTKMVISNLSDAEFKTLVITMLKELIGYFNSITKTQAEMKLTLSEIKKNLQGTNSGVNEAENQIIWNIRKKKYSVRTATPYWRLHQPGSHGLPLHGDYLRLCPTQLTDVLFYNRPCY